MKTYYTIDSGNTNYKIASFSPTGEQLSLEIVPSLKDYSFKSNSSSIFCSVNKKEPILENLICVSLIREELDFVTDYGPSLGEDRLVTSYYIQKKFPKTRKAIVDAGTFITIDIITDEKHMGGYIYPGVQTFLNTYNNQGKNLPRISFNPDSQLSQHPSTTDEAINQATKNYLKSLESFLKELNLDTVFLTGGDQCLLSDSLADEVIRDSDLVHKSLFYIMKKYV